MPSFGEFETVGAPAEVTHERGFVTTIWQARKVGGGENRLFAIKVYSPKQSSMQSDGAAHAERQRAFLEGARQLQGAGAAGEESRLCPIHDVGLSEEGVWYATDFFRRGSLKTWISRLGEIDSDSLKHVLHEVVSGCLSLHSARGHGHGNLKPANVLLTGKPRPLRETRLLLADPYPAAPLMLAQWDPASRPAEPWRQPVSEAGDLRALGELILQLVESRLVRSVSGYNYPIEDSEHWQKLGRNAEYWRHLCNRLLDPELSTDTVSLPILEQELRPEVRTTRIPRMLTGVGLICLLLLVGVATARHLKSPAKAGVATQAAQPGPELETVQSAFDRGDYPSVLAAAAEYPNDTRFVNLSNLAYAERQQLRSGENRLAAGDYRFIEELRSQKFSSKDPVASLLRKAEEERQLLQSLWALTNSLPDLKRRLREPAIVRLQKAPFDQLRTWVDRQSVNAAALGADWESAQVYFDQGEYQQMLAICRRYPDEVRLAGLAGRAKAEMQQLEQSKQSLDRGDYTFIERLSPQAYGSKPPFAALLKQGMAERQLLEGLWALTNSPLELHQRLAESPAAGITKPPFQALREWAQKESGALSKRELETARDLLGKGGYTNVLTICARHPNVQSFAELEAAARAELNTLATSRANFEKGNYGFVDSLRKEPFSAKPAFASLLDEAGRERAWLEDLQALRRAGKWEQLLARMSKSGVGRIAKPPFEELRKSVALRNQELIKDLRRHQARLGALPRGEPSPLDEEGKPVVRLSRNRPATIYLAPLRQLKQDFQEINQLTAERKREFEELENVIFRWFD